VGCMVGVWAGAARGAGVGCVRVGCGQVWGGSSATVGRPCCNSVAMDQTTSRRSVVFGLRSYVRTATGTSNRLEMPVRRERLTASQLSRLHNVEDHARVHSTAVCSNSVVVPVAESGNKLQYAMLEPIIRRSQTG